MKRFFKTGKGEYGEGDVFMGITVPEQRKIAGMNRDLSLKGISQLLKCKEHECRLTAFIILIGEYIRADKIGKEKIFSFYIKNLEYVNNWDLVDCSAPYIIGKHLLSSDKGMLYNLAISKNIWERRIAIISTLAFIREGNYKDTFAIADMLMKDNHDLIHKACGWMLREVYKKDNKVAKEFITKRKDNMPRTMLRYAIERFPEKERKSILS